MQSKAVLRMARVSPQKARLVADLIRGKRASEAQEMLKFTRKKSATLFLKLVESAVANAEHKAKAQNGSVDIDNLYIQTITVDKGPSLRRWRPRAQGRATRIEKQTSHITVVLGEREE